jgi:uncharacterized protein YndB with AHSA1/START domain
MLQPPERTCLLIADISGYTAYLAGVELDHAQDILADLIGTVVTTLRPTFRLAKLEGDAAFMAAPEAEVDGSLLLDTIERCYFGFRRRRRDVRQATSCECDACVRIPDLNLKFVAHVGPVVRQEMAGMEELIGRDVIVVHRLLKNTVGEATGVGAYALLTDACTTAMALGPAGLGMTPHAETYDVVGEVPGWVLDLERRWEDEDRRARVFVRPEDTFLSTGYEVAAPPAVVWEYLTTPARRVQWMAGVTDVVQDATGNRRAVGGTNHCMHGKDAIVEEILDWRPFDYFTIRSIVQTPAGPVGIPNTFELTPTATGTRVSLRFQRLTDPAELAIIEPMAPMFQGMVDTGAAALRALLGSEMQARAAAAPPEPDVPAPRPDGKFANLPPIEIVG